MESDCTRGPQGRYRLKSPVVPIGAVNFTVTMLFMMLLVSLSLMAALRIETFAVTWPASIGFSPLSDCE